MKNFRFLFNVAIATTFYISNVNAQTLVVPGGTVGSSGNANVGVGVSSPNSKFEIRGPSFRLSDVDIRYLQISQDGDGQPYGRSTTNNYAGARQFKLTGWSHTPTNMGSELKDIVHFDGYNLLLLKDNGGNVGIGTATPYSASRLHVKAPGPNLWASIVEASGNQRIIGMSHDGNAGFVSVSYLNGEGYSPLYLNTSNLTRMAIATDGKIGVGLTDPSHLFQINDLNNPTLAIGKANAENNGKSSIAFYAGKSGVANAFTVQYRREPNVDRLAFLDGGNQERLTIVNGGNVGIGTVNPDARLAVKGTVHAEEVKVDLNVPVPDYVFEKNYDLRSLAEVEAYINQNKHLPEIPAAKEMEKNGVNLGEMNMMLLKKVEELTLYIIEQEKRIQNLERKR